MQPLKVREKDFYIKNIPLAIHICHKIYYKNPFIRKLHSKEDAEQISFLSLIKAIQSFKKELGLKLSAILSKCIYNDLIDYKNSFIKVSGRGYYDLLNIKIGKAPIYNVQKQIIKDCEKASKVVSIDIFESMEIICKKQSITEQIFDKENLELIRRILNKLREKDKEVLCQKFGIDTQELSNPQIGELNNVTNEAIRRRIEQAIKNFLKIYRKERQDVRLSTMQKLRYGSL